MAELLPDQVEQQVLEWLPWVEEEMLIQIYGELAIQIPPNKTGKTMILKLILKYLHSEATFRFIHAYEKNRREKEGFK